VEADFAFHLKVAAAAGNRFYSELIGSLGPMMIMLPRTQLDPAYEMSDPGHVTRVVHEHENIYAAIARSDPESARAAARVHLANTRHRLTMPSEHR
jgi:GntR family transcriptional repressor for pyruvate dehydrogenase complex